MKRLMSAAVAALSLLLCACGGGTPQVLPLDETSPHAYTLDYLKEHPGTAIRPQHLLIATIDPKGPNGGRESVAVQIDEPTTISLALEAGQSVLVKVAIVDPSGAEMLSHTPGQDVATASLQPGLHTIVLLPDAAADDGRPHTVYLKLADTATQSQRRQQLSLTTTPTALGAVAVDTCTGCSFANMNLSGRSFAGQNLASGNFDGVTLKATDFSNAVCNFCMFTNIKSSDLYSRNGSTFADAYLLFATFNGPGGAWITGLRFNGADLSYATLKGAFSWCDFSPSTASGKRTSMQHADLTQGGFVIYPDTTQMLQYVDFSYAQMTVDTFAIPASIAFYNTVFVGAIFANVTPANVFTSALFRGMDLSGIDFTGVDLSHIDLSVGNSVKLSATTLLAGATLSNGSTGVNLAGQNVAFPSPFVAWAGTVGDVNSGKDLRYINLSGIDLSRADLTRANLSGALLRGSVMPEGTVLAGTNLSLANLYGAKLTGSQLGVAPGTAGVAPANLANAYMPLADLTDADLRSVSMDYVHLYGFDSSPVSLLRARLDSASMVGAQLMDTDFTQASLNDTDLTGAVLVNAKFSGAQLTNTKLESTVLFGADFSSVASMAGSSLNNAATGDPLSPSPYAFTENNGVGYSFKFSAIAYGPIATSGNLYCPNGDNGPCNSAAKLTPTLKPVYPVASQCVVSRQYCSKNCDVGWVKPATPPKC